MARLISNADEIARHLQLEGDLSSLQHTVRTAAEQVTRDQAFATLVGTLTALVEVDHRAAAVVVEPERLRDDFPREELNQACERLVEAFIAAVEQRVAARTRR